MNKAKGPDGMSAKFVKISATLVDCYIANIINKNISSLIINSLNMLKLQL